MYSERSSEELKTLENIIEGGEKIESSPSSDFETMSEEEILRIQKEDEEKLVAARQELDQVKSGTAVEDIKEVGQPASNNVEEVKMGGETYIVEYVPKEDLSPFFGMAGGNVASVREDLSPRVKRFVRSHELYHLTDRASWGGALGRELRANIIPGLKDPLGLIATIVASLSKERLKLYIDRIRKRY
ncbi:MAG: hypothetical protein KGZ97_03550 [Bacteroidetes bacterium]|nr:hypothetical protein [Bacteroidota bacterium]